MEERRLNVTGICTTAVNRTHLFDTGIWINVPQGRYDTCSDGQCANVGPTFWVKEFNPFDPELDLVRFQVLKGTGYEW